MRLKVSRGRTDPQFISNLHREQVTALFVLLNQYISTLCTNTCYPTFNIQERIQKNLFVCDQKYIILFQDECSDWSLPCGPRNLRQVISVIYSVSTIKPIFLEFYNHVCPYKNSFLI
jgi:hypothetical protein